MKRVSFYKNSDILVAYELDGEYFSIMDLGDTYYFLHKLRLIGLGDKGFPTSEQALAAAINYIKTTNK
jgi:hypothetical protein